MLLIDLEQKRIISDEELKSDLASRHPYKKWLQRTQLVLREMPPAKTKRPRSPVALDRPPAGLRLYPGRPQAAHDAAGPDRPGGRGLDGHRHADLGAVGRAKLLDTYFMQNFAQVTNPPIDPIREELVMSLVSFIGPRPNLLDLKGTSRHMRLEVPQPILTNEELERIRTIGTVAENPFRTVTIDITYDVANGPHYMEAALEAVCTGAERAVRDGYNIIILSDRAISAERVPIPALLATSATHHHLIRQGLRTSVGLVVESGEPREVHQFCTLAGYGAEAINPYLAFETLEELLPQLGEELTRKAAFKRYIKGIDKGLLKVMSKMGISTFQSYCGAQIFDAVGLQERIHRPLLHRHGHPDRRHRACRGGRRGVPPPCRRLRRQPGLSRCPRCRRRVSLPGARRNPCLGARRGRSPAARGARQFARAGTASSRAW
jgi:glutamate synthase (NADPH) large chain